MSGRVVIGSRYELRSRLGAGGFGTVWRAHDYTLQRDVAVKLLSVESVDRDAIVSRFWREARAVASLNHPNIVIAHDFGVHDNTAYLVMEFIPGASLADEMIARRRSGHPRLDPRRAVRLAAQVSAGLAAAHTAGLVHRDLKPANIMVVPVTGQAKIVDFGIARAAEAGRITATGDYLGTLPYASPEQMTPGEVDGRSDLYSLGCLLYEMLAGASPYNATSPAQWVAAHQSAAPIPLRDRCPDLPAELERLVHDLLQKAPNDRPSSADAVRARLERCARLVVPAPGLSPREAVSAVVPPMAATEPVAAAEPMAVAEPVAAAEPVSRPAGSGDASGPGARPVAAGSAALAAGLASQAVGPASTAAALASSSVGGTSSEVVPSQRMADSAIVSAEATGGDNGVLETAVASADAGANAFPDDNANASPDGKANASPDGKAAAGPGGKAGAGPDGKADGGPDGKADGGPEAKVDLVKGREGGAFVLAPPRGVSDPVAQGGLSSLPHSLGADVPGPPGADSTAAPPSDRLASALPAAASATDAPTVVASAIAYTSARVPIPAADSMLPPTLIGPLLLPSQRVRALPAETAAPARPLTAIVAGRLLMVIAVCSGLQAALAGAAVAPVASSVQRAFSGLPDDSGSHVVLYLMLIAIVWAVVTVAVGVLAGANLRGSRAARITTWALAAPFAVACFIGVGTGDTLTTAATPSTGDVSARVVVALSDVRAAIPGWYIGITSALDVIGLMAFVATVVLLAAPQTNAFIHHRVRNVRHYPR